MGAENTAFRIDVARQYDERAKHLPWSSLRQSTLRDISTNFPPADGYNFLYHLDRKLQKGPVAVFEFGGGADQSVALELFFRFNIGRYTAFDAQPLNEDTRDRLAAYPQHRFVQGGVVDVDPEVVGRGEYDMVFANDVALFLPDPFLLLEKMHDIAKKDGVIFMNGILLRSGVAKAVMEQWAREGQHVGIKNVSMKKGSDVVKLDIAIKKTKDTLFVPEPSDTHLEIGNDTYTVLDYTQEKERRKDPTPHDIYIRRFVADRKKTVRERAAATPTTTIFDAMGRAQGSLKRSEYRRNKKTTDIRKGYEKYLVEKEIIGTEDQAPAEPLVTIDEVISHAEYLLSK